MIRYLPSHPHVSQTTELRVLPVFTHEALSDVSFSVFEHASLLPEMPFPNLLLILDVTSSAISFQTFQDRMYIPLNVY